ncbi:MAG: hypothetical protein C4294_14780, partial [Nitrospiraceae bacterium]
TTVQTMGGSSASHHDLFIIRCSIHIAMSCIMNHIIVRNKRAETRRLPIAPAIMIQSTLPPSIAISTEPLKSQTNVRGRTALTVLNSTV